MNLRVVFFTVALLSAISSSAHSRQQGAIVAWGNNDFGQAGVVAGDDFVSLSAGYGHSIALHADGSITVIGVGIYLNVSPGPTGNDFVAADAGEFHCLALRSDGSLVACRQF